MVRPLFALGLALALPCCGAATDGAALVHGTLFAGEKPWETSLEFTGRTVIHGAGPFRLVVSREEQAKGETGHDGKSAGLAITIRYTRLPDSGETIALGGEESPIATVDSVVADKDPPKAVPDGADVRWSDGSFTVQATGGTLWMELAGREKGNGARGRFELVFKTGETVTGTFSAALAD